MKRFILFVLGAILINCTVWTPRAEAATEAEKTTAIQNALAHLASLQNEDGSFDLYTAGNDYQEAATGAVLFAFLSQKAKWGSHAAQYQAAVDGAVSYLLANATKDSKSTRGDGKNICPGGSGSCPTVFWDGIGEATYSTGLIMPALDSYAVLVGPNKVATTTGVLAGMTWRQIAQANTNGWAAGQTSLNGALNGGWRYYPAEEDSDSSTTQWAVISLIFNEAAGATTPSIVKTSLTSWLGQVQDPSGAVCYQPQPTDNYICDHADTGGWLLSKQYVANGGTGGDTHIAAALNYLNTNWKLELPSDSDSPFSGHFGHPYAMWGVYKGLETTIGLTNNTTIANLKTNCGGTGHMPSSGVCNWWEDYNQWLVASQSADGSWAGYAYWPDPLSTAFFTSILGATPVPVIPVPSSVPALSTFAFVALGLLLIGTAVLLMRRPHAR